MNVSFQVWMDYPETWSKARAAAGVGRSAQGPSLWQGFCIGARTFP
jgi:hypothetical protein